MSTAHTGQQLSNHVTLETILVEDTDDPKQDLDFIRINQDDTRPAGPPWFRVPTGQVFVVTDVDWQYNLGAGGQVQNISYLH